MEFLFVVEPYLGDKRLVEILLDHGADGKLRLIGTTDLADEHQVQRRCEQFLASRAIGSVETNVVYAVARRPR